MANTEGVAVDKFEIADCNLLPNAEFSYAINGLEVSFINESENAVITSYSIHYTKLYETGSFFH